MRLLLAVFLLVFCVAEVLAEPLRRYRMNTYEGPVAKRRVRELFGKRSGDNWDYYPSKRGRELLGKRSVIPAKRRGRELFGKRSAAPDFSEDLPEFEIGDIVYEDELISALASMRRERRARGSRAKEFLG